MVKEFGHLSRENIREIYAGLIDMLAEQEEFFQLAAESNKIDSFVQPWAAYYELDFITLLALMVDASGMQDLVNQAAQSEDPQSAALDILSKHDIDLELDDGGKMEYLSILMALNGHIEAFRRFSQPMSLLINKVRDGNLDALFRAVTVDRTVIAAPTILKQISISQLKRDEMFMKRLAKAITRTKPARPKPKYDDFRFMLEVMLEKHGIQAFTSSQIEDILQHDLELYTNDGDYANRALRKMLQERNRMVGT